MTHKKNISAHNAGFSLVEMSIVLTIIGLLIGGTLVAFDLRRGAEVRAVLTERGQIITAVATFRQKYLALPGDMRNATSYWGAADAVAATCITTASTDALTCNGNGNQKIDISGTPYELFRFWQHLANAELIQGNYTGVSGSGGTMHHMRNVNAMASKSGSLMWETGNYDSYAGSTNLFAADYDNVLIVGKPTATTDPAEGGGFTPEEAWSLDQKGDDGAPGTGVMMVGNWDSCTNAAANTDAATATYDTTNESDACSVIFTKQF